MGTTVNWQDLLDLHITSQEGGGFRVSAKCPLCGERVYLYLSASDVEQRCQVEAPCKSGKDEWPRSFQLSARHNPDETDHESGVDVWGFIEGEGGEE